jgi:hypothetical protein
VKASLKRNTSSVLFGSLLSGNIRLPRGHFNGMEASAVLSEYSGISEDAPEVERVGWEANAKESVPGKPMVRTIPIKNLIDNFISKKPSQRQGMLNIRCVVLKTLKQRKNLQGLLYKVFIMDARKFLSQWDRYDTRISIILKKP